MYGNGGDGDVRERARDVRESASEKRDWENVIREWCSKWKTCVSGGEGGRVSDG